MTRESTARPCQGRARTEPRFVPTVGYQSVGYGDMPEAALEWIVATLRRRDIPFVICGGLAAIGYGARRPLHDIDLFVPGRHFRDAVAAGNDYMAKVPRRRREGGWDVEYAQFIYAEVKIEVGSAAGVRVWDRRAGCWSDLKINFRRRHWAQVFGVDLPLMDLRDLVDYKKKLDRQVDREDVAAIESRLA